MTGFLEAYKTLCRSISELPKELKKIEANWGESDIQVISLGSSYPASKEYLKAFDALNDESNYMG